MNPQDIPGFIFLYDISPPLAEGCMNSIFGNISKCLTVYLESAGAVTFDPDLVTGEDLAHLLMSEMCSLKK